MYINLILKKTETNIVIGAEKMGFKTTVSRSFLASAITYFCIMFVVVFMKQIIGV